MPRARTVLRLAVFFLAFVSFLPAVWLALPCPTGGIDHIKFPTTTLRQGKPLLRVYESQVFFPNYVTTEGLQLPNYRSPIERQFFALEVTLHPESVQVNNASISLKHMPAHPEKASHDTIIFIETPVSDGDGIVLPFWPMADRALLQWEIEKENATLPLRVRHLIDDLKHTFDVYPDHTNKPLGSVESDTFNDQPLLRLVWDEYEGVEEEARVEASVPGGPIDDSPSHTYGFRLKMLSLMGPPILHLTATYGDIISVVFSWIAWFVKNTFIGFYVGGCLIAVIWLVIGRPPMERMIRGGNVLRLRSVDSAALRMEHARAQYGTEKGQVRLMVLLKALVGKMPLHGQDDMDSDDKLLDVEKGFRSD